MKRIAKRLLVCLCALSLLLSALPGAVASGAQVELEDKTVTQGSGTESVSVPVTLSGNTGIAGMTLIVSYAEGITLTGIATGEALTSLTYTKPGNMSANPLNLVWDGLEADTSNGVVATLTFEVPKTEAAEYEISVTPDGVFDNNVNEVTISAVSCKITVLPTTSAVEYKYGQGAQIRLIEPWALKANARVYTAAQTVNIDYSSLVDYGAYFIRASKLSDPTATQTSLTVEDIINDADAAKYSKKDGTAEVEGSYITATYDKGLYTYEFDDSVFVLFYVQDDSGISYALIRERNLKSLLETRQNDTVNFPNELERNVYKAMLAMFDTVNAYRDDFFENN